MRRVALFVLLVLLGACTQDRRTDEQKLSDFHRRLVVVDHRVAAASATYTSASKAALARGDHAALYNAASALRLAMVAALPAAQGIDLPNFKNKDAGGDAEQALAALTAEINALADASAGLKAVYDPHRPVPAALAIVAQAQDQANTNAVEETSEIVQAYDDLGIAPDRIDMANGGLRGK